MVFSYEIVIHLINTLLTVTNYRPKKTLFNTATYKLYYSNENYFPSAQPY